MINFYTNKNMRVFDTVRNSDLIKYEIQTYISANNDKKYTLFIHKKGTFVVDLLNKKIIEIRVYSFFNKNKYTAYSCFEIPFSLLFEENDEYLKRVELMMQRKN